MSKKIFLLAVILIIASFFRLYQINQTPPGLYPDEAMNGNNALQALRTAPPAGGFKVFYPENAGREGLFINIQAFFLNLFKVNEPWVLRLPSAIFGVLTVLGVYFLTKELFGENLKSQAPNSKQIQNSKPFGNWKLEIGNYEVALLSSFLMATSFWHINFSRIGFRAIMAPFFLTWTLYFLLYALKKAETLTDSIKIFIPAAIGGIFYGLGFYSYIAYRATPLLIFIILLIYWLKNKNSILKTSDALNTDNRNFRTSDVRKLIRKKILLVAFFFSLIALIVFTPLGLYFLQNPQDFFGRTSQISIFNSSAPLKNLGLNILKTAGMFNFVGDGNWRHNYAGKPELFWPVGILFVIGVILGIARLFKAPSTKHQIPNNDQNSKEFGNWNLFGIGNLGFVILFSWLIIAALPVVISNEGLPHALRAILMIPPVFILAAIGGFWFYKFLKTKIRPATLKVFTIIFCGFLIFETLNTYFILWAKNPNVYNAFNSNYLELAKKLNELPKELPKYVIVEAGGMTVPMKSAFYADEDKIVNVPMPAQTIMFITDTFDFQKQKEKNIFYVLPEKINRIPENSFTIELK
ncbi:hypothetical protein CO130_00650 [Candidatus Jorgensenbacteria bacterium CG_4_9_14_3_um_filter_38_10]|nr:MAG: hypothetical protein CO130_00650 [Candidatus Jorgensenbacteria bacterium CG_4_9_14_3_um_filter_38_10]